jgi:SAM-dependent methyltransferase
MTNEDIRWVQRLLDQKIIEGPVLELGVGYGGATCREMIETAGLQYYGTDLEKTPAVDFVADFEKSQDMTVFAPAAPFGTVLILNVLEHTFDPLRVLDNAISLLKPGGRCAVLTPSIWPLHNWPMDTWRILPDFYETYAKRRGLAFDARFFDYPGHGPVMHFRSLDGSYVYPPPCASKARLLGSRVIHRIFNTFGRGMFHPSHVAVAAVFQRPVAD